MRAKPREMSGLGGFGLAAVDGMSLLWDTPGQKTNSFRPGEILERQWEERLCFSSTRPPAACGVVVPACARQGALEPLKRKTTAQVETRSDNHP